MTNAKPGDVVETRWGAIGVIQVVQPKPFPAFPEEDLTALVQVGGVTHRLCLDGLTLYVATNG